MRDTYQQMWSRVLLRCPAASSFLARDWITNAFRQVAERRRWSWLVKRGQFVSPPLVRDGFATATTHSTAIVGTGTAWDASLVGRQFRIGISTPIHTIVEVLSPTSLVLDQEWGAASVGPTNYQIYQCYFSVPEDFHAFVSVWDPAMNWQLWRHIHWTEINLWDAQRANMGQVYCVAAMTYDASPGGLPRYELWPHQQSAYVYPFLYESRPPDLQDPDGALPRYVRGDVLVEMALAQAARWPGPSVDKPNPYFSLKLGEVHDLRAEKMMLEMERQDDETYEQDMIYDTVRGWPYATPLGDSAWLQSHAI